MDHFEKQMRSLPSTLQVILAPPFVDLMFFSNRLLNTEKNSHVKLAVQDISPFPAGAYTGAIGTKNLEGFGVSYAIVGHSERRHYFHETNNEVANKVRESLACHITPIVCVTKDTVIPQASAIEDRDRSHVIVAFEPIENIGTGITDSLSDILQTKERVTNSFGDVPYIYGGSVDTKTDPDLLRSDAVDGFLVGTASLEADAFRALLKLMG